MAQDPKKGDGWNFLEADSDAWYEAFETYETQNGETHVDIDAYEEFDNIQELVNFVAGTGSYQNTRQFTPNQEDLTMKKREMHNDQWKIPEKLDEIQGYIENGADLAQIDVDPDAATNWNISETDAQYKKDVETQYTAHFIAYDPEDRSDENTHFYIAASWYDTPPEQINFEDIFQELEPKKE